MIATECRQDRSHLVQRQSEHQETFTNGYEAHHGSTVVEPVTLVQNLGVYMDGELNMQVHIGKISSACFYHLRRLRQLRNIISSATMQHLVSAFVLSQLDYYNPVLAGLPAVTLKKTLHRVMNAAVRLFVGLGWRDHITPAMRDLHWLPIIYRIRYTLCILMHAAANNNSTEYITELLVRNSLQHYHHSLQAVTSYHDQRQSSAREPSVWLDPQRGTNCRRS